MFELFLSKILLSWSLKYILHESKSQNVDNNQYIFNKSMIKLKKIQLELIKKHLLDRWKIKVHRNDENISLMCTHFFLYILNTEPYSIWIYDN